MIIGILGGGQLARMLALAGIPLGMRFIFLEPAKDACITRLGEHLCGDYDNIKLLTYISKIADVITYEFENIPDSSIEFLTNKRVNILPGQKAFTIARDRLNEKYMFQELNIPTVPFYPVNSLSDLKLAIAEITLPAILKTRLLGYDGKGQVLIPSGCLNDYHLNKILRKLGNNNIPLILEKLVDFKREISIIGVRNYQGEITFYPLSQNYHIGGILHSTQSLPVNDPRESKAREFAKKIMEHLDYIGVMTLELFDTGIQLLANEIAPRVHNSGHWTIEGAAISQFENHIRSITRLPLGSTAVTVRYTKMINFIGTIPEISTILSEPKAHFHNYDKKPKPGRKLGHVTFCSNTQFKDKDEA